MSKTFFFSLIHFVKLPCFHVVPLFPLFLVQIFVVLFLFFSGFPHFFFNLTLARLFLVVVVFYVFLYYKYHCILVKKYTYGKV